MKKILLSLLLVTSLSFVASAVPARPGKFTRTLPDGSVIVLENHGDEYFHWLTDEKGRIVEEADNGFFYPVNPAIHAARRSRGLALRKATWSSYETAPATNFGDRKILCLLANFSDSTFVIDNPNERFYNMLNQAGYAENGGIGSVRDYYIDNSGDQYRPQFDVFGPVQLTQSSAYYDQNGVKLAILEAYELLQGQINIGDYDTDNDGDIDMVLFYYPGHNEAEGGGAASIWPHQNSGSFGTMGGKTFNRYFCTSELKGNKGSEMCAIGTTCHEFAHSLGLPDFYDTDYGENGTGYNTHTTDKYDLMANGNYNDNGRRPPYLSAVERNMLGWMPNLPTLPAGTQTLAPVRENQAFISESGVDGEYFVLECRDKYKWDSAIPSAGLLVYHIDKSSRVVPGSGRTAAWLWANTNKINVYGGHPCYYLYTADDGSSYVFPGASGITSLQLNNWDGNATGVLLSEISMGTDGVSFNVISTTDRMMTGYVYNSTGAPVEGARIILRRSAYPFSAAPALLTGDQAVTSDASGYYAITLPSTASNEQILVVDKEGYVPVCVNVATASQFTRQNFYLPRLGEGEHQTLQRYDPSYTFYNTSPRSANFAAAFYYPASELAGLGLAGRLLESISFMASPTSYDKVYVLVDIGGQRALLREVTARFAPGTMITISVADAGVVLPDGADVYIGYGITGAPENDYCVNMYGPEDADKNGSYINRDFLNGGTWKKTSFSGTNGSIYFNYVISAEISKGIDVSLSDYGVAYIVLNESVPKVVPPAGKTVYTTEWFLDGTAVEAPAALSSLPEGAHTYKVRLTYYDGTVETVFYDFSN